MPVKAIAEAPRLTEDQEAEWARCCQNTPEAFIYWCSRYGHIQDKETGRTILFAPFRCQIETIRMLVPGLPGSWPWVLKARQLGFTWLMALLAVWRVTFRKLFDVACMNQDKEYAEDFISRCLFVLQHMPEWQRPILTQESKKRLTFGTRHCSVRAFASSKKAARSLTANLVVMDEAAFIEHFGDAKTAAEPSLEQSKGTLVVMSTSDGPSGAYYDGWRFNESRPADTKFKNVFFGWKERPGRDEAWYIAEQKAHAEDPLYMKREYPATPEEAFEAAAGRVYPMFGRETHVPKVAMEMPLTAHRYRCVDWGSVDPFVCLWVMHNKDSGPKLTIDPTCEELIAEMLAYSRNERTGRPEDKKNHGPDALRYLVTTCRLTGHVHVYRELYIHESAAKGISVPDQALRVIQHSRGEDYLMTVADRSRPDSIVLFCQKHVPTCAAISIQERGSRKDEIEQGIDRVNALVAGEVPVVDAEEPRDSEETWDDHFMQDGSMDGRYKRLMKARKARELARHVHPALGSEW